jgi:hypothetical protein
MTRKPVLIAVLASAALLVAAPNARTQWQSMYHYNALTGEGDVPGKSYNPLTGTYYRKGVAYNPWTGRYPQGTSVYNFFNNSFSGGVTAYNPFTGTMGYYRNSPINP